MKAEGSWASWGAGRGQQRESIKKQVTAEEVEGRGKGSNEV